jgi:hypothetical protein
MDANLATHNLTAQEVCHALGVTPQWLAAKIKKGMPCRVLKGSGGSSKKGADRRRFNEEAVADWLENEGLAERDESLLASATADNDLEAHTVNEAVQMLAAKGLKVDKRTFADWIDKPDFPGTPGRPGRRDAKFPIMAILAWHGGLTTRAGESPEDSRRARLLDIQIATKEIELAKMQGEVIDRQVAYTLIDQINTTWLAIVTPLASEISAELPSELQTEAANKINRRIENGRVAVADIIKLHAQEEEKARAQRVIAANS